MSKLQTIKPLCKWQEVWTDGKHIGDIAVGHSDIFLLLYDVPHVPGFKSLTIKDGDFVLDGHQIEASILVDLAEQYNKHCAEIDCGFYKTYGFNCYRVLAEWLLFMADKQTELITFKGPK